MNNKLVLQLLVVSTLAGAHIKAGSAFTNAVQTVEQSVKKAYTPANVDQIGWANCLNINVDRPQLINNTGANMYIMVPSLGIYTIKPYTSFSLDSRFKYLVAGDPSGFGAAFLVQFDYKTLTWSSTKCFIRNFSVDQTMAMSAPLIMDTKANGAPNLGINSWKSKLDPIADAGAIYTTTDCNASIVITGNK